MASLDKPAKVSAKRKARDKEVFIYWYRCSSIYFNFTTKFGLCLGDPLPIILKLISEILPKMFNFN